MYVCMYVCMYLFYLKNILSLYITRYNFFILIVFLFYLGDNIFYKINVLLSLCKKIVFILL